MRAIFLENFHFQDIVEIKGEVFHHLCNVLRVKIDEQILILDGKGTSYLSTISSISKKELKLKVISSSFAEKRKLKISVAFGIIKKDALELALKNSVELGVDKIFLLKTTYSQKLTFNEDRIHRILVSALEQSNNKYLPEVLTCSFEELLEKDIKIFYFSSVQKSELELKEEIGNEFMALFGPEGGLSPDEEKVLEERKNTFILNIDCPILRTPNALSVGIGYIMGMKSIK